MGECGVDSGRDQGRRTLSTTLAALAVLALLGAIALGSVSIGGTGDTPCGSIYAPNFSSGPAEALASEGQCGIVYRSTAAVSAGLVVFAACLLLLLLRRVTRPARAATVVAGLASLVAATYASVGAEVGMANADATMRMGWLTSRTLVAWSALGFGLTAVALMLVSRAASKPGMAAATPDRHGSRLPHQRLLP